MSIGYTNNLKTKINENVNLKIFFLILKVILLVTKNLSIIN